MAKVLRFPNSSQGGRNAKTRGRLVRRVMRRTSSFRPRGDRYGVDPRCTPARCPLGADSRIAAANYTTRY